MIHKIFFWIIKINAYRGELADNSAKNEALTVSNVHARRAFTKTCVVLDSDSVTYQGGELTKWHSGSVDFLQEDDSADGQALTLYAYKTTFHHDNVHANAPLYIGPLVTDDKTGFIVRGTDNGALQSSPLVRTLSDQA